MRGVIVIGMLAAAITSPASAGRSLNRLAAAFAEAAERNEAYADEEMRKLVGPAYESAPEQQFSESSREAQMNIPFSAIVHTEYNGTLARLFGTDRDTGTHQREMVGSVIWASFEYFVRPAAAFLADVDISAGPDAYYRAPSTAVFDVDQYGVCTTEKYGFFKGVAKKRICLYDADADGKAEQISGIEKFAVKFSPPSAIPYRLYAKSAIASKFRRELIYLGQSNGVLRFSYREYQTNLIRPAFTTEMTYDIDPSGPTMVRFKDTAIRVDKVSNEGIEYTVLDR